LILFVILQEFKIYGDIKSNLMADIDSVKNH